MKRLFEYGLVIAIVVIVASMFRPITFLNRKEYRAEVRALYEQLHPAMTRPQVQRAMELGDYPNLRFSRDDDQTWYASAPLEFGAGNWILLIEFEREAVSALRVRTSDSFQDHPSGAPPDK